MEDASAQGQEGQSVLAEKEASDSKNGPFAIPGKPPDEYTDGRLPGQWQTKYPAEARRCINQEACVLAVGMILLCLVDGILLGMSGQTIILPINSLAKQPDATATALRIDLRWLSIFFIGCLVLLQTGILSSGRDSLSDDNKTLTQVLARKTSGDTFELPFTFFGFMEVDQPRSIVFEDFGIRLHITLKNDRIEFRISRGAEQLELPLDLSVN